MANCLFLKLVGWATNHQPPVSTEAKKEVSLFTKKSLVQAPEGYKSLPKTEAKTTYLPKSLWSSLRKAASLYQRFKLRIVNMSLFQSLEGYKFPLNTQAESTYLLTNPSLDQSLEGLKSLTKDLPKLRVPSSFWSSLRKTTRPYQRLKLDKVIL